MLLALLDFTSTPLLFVLSVSLFFIYLFICICMYAFISEHSRCCQHTISSGLILGSMLLDHSNRARFILILNAGFSRIYALKLMP